MAHLAGKRIAVSGAGIGGTAFALAMEQLCKASSIKPMPIIKIYERDASPTARENFGYSFSVIEALPVLHQLGRGIVEDLQKLQEPGNAAHFCYQNFDPLIQVNPSKEIVLRIMRTRLRQTLLSKVPAECLEYDKVCTSAEPGAQAGQPVSLEFSDGCKEECDMLVVADGANSKLRTALLPNEVNRYAGICMLFGRTDALEEVPPALLRGLHLVFGKGKTTLFMGTVDKNTVVWGLTMKGPRSRADELNELFKDPAKAEDYLQNEVPKLGEEFSGAFPSILKQTPASSLIVYPATDKIPHPVKDDCIAYIGDAWHPMSPFAGAGANMALQDAWELAEELVNGGHDSIRAAISAFAVKAPKRSASAIRFSRINIAVAHSEGWKKQLLILILRAVSNVMRLVRSLQSSTVSQKQA